MHFHSGMSFNWFVSLSITSVPHLVSEFIPTSQKIFYRPVKIYKLSNKQVLFVEVYPDTKLCLRCIYCIFMIVATFECFTNYRLRYCGLLLIVVLTVLGWVFLAKYTNLLNTWSLNSSIYFVALCETEHHPISYLKQVFWGLN